MEGSTSPWLPLKPEGFHWALHVPPSEASSCRESQEFSIFHSLIHPSSPPSIHLSIHSSVPHHVGNAGLSAIRRGEKEAVFAQGALNLVGDELSM